MNKPVRDVFADAIAALDRPDSLVEVPAGFEHLAIPGLVGAVPADGTPGGRCHMPGVRVPIRRGSRQDVRDCGTTRPSGQASCCRTVAAWVEAILRPM